MIYSLHRRSGMRSIRLTVRRDGSVVVSAAKQVPVAVIDKLLRDRAVWIETQRIKLQQRVTLAPAPSLEDYRRHQARALVFAKERVAYFAAIYGFAPTRISVRNSRLRWGSCSSRRILNFSYRIVFLPPNLADYLVVHELCHLKEMNHSKQFWDLVAKTIPTYRELRQQLRMG